MFAFVFQSLTSLLLAGVFVYAIFSSDWLKDKRFAQQVLLGVTFGVMVISLGMSSIALKIIPTQFDAKAGPLIIAGYLGGPVGGLIAGLCGALYRVSFGGPVLGIAVFMNLATAAIGVGAYYLRPSPNWPTIQKSTIIYIVVAFTLLHFIPFWYLSSISEAPNPYIVSAQVMVAFTLMGFLSIFLTSLIVKKAADFANNARQTADLSKKLDLAMRASGMGLFDHQIGDPAILLDAGMIAIYGLDREPGPGPLSEWAALVHPDDRLRVRRHIERVWAGEDVPDRMDFRATRTDGALRYIRATWFTELNADGTAKRVSGIHIDLTDIRLAEQRDKASAERLATIAEKLPGAIVEFDVTNWDEPELLVISPNCFDIWGYTSEEILADPSLLSQMHDPEDLGDFLQANKTSCETGEPLHHRFMITARDGQPRWLDYHGGSSNENGRVLVKAIVLDATREVEAQLQVDKEREISRNAQKIDSIGQLTGGVAHDFNNLLAVILGNLELLRDFDEPGLEKEVIETAITATLKGADLTRNMLAFARKAPLMPVKLDLNKVVLETKNWIGRTLPESVIVETSLLAGLWPVEADRASLESALLNLTLNARDAMEGKGNLTIETANVRIDQTYLDARQEELVPGRYVLLAVSDTGSGIPDEALGSIFEPFFTTKTIGEGSGLGLSMTFGFMRQSGGTIQVYTEIGQGTTFKLYFPAAAPQGDEEATPSVGNYGVANKSGKLLLAEDEAAVRDTLVRILELSGYQVLATATGDAACAAFEADPTFDLLLTDIVMPGKLQGTDLAKSLRERWPALPVIFMSGYASEATVHGNGLRPEDVRMMKPVQSADLLAAVRKVLSTA
ncbi:PAS domain-containing protein [Phaeobacter sp. B1627]|uniref:PAS domain-containing protein n=1 Tax=Phaeobacter sp. B1627 TaxID=2583809 RepID=UPI00111B14BF|nr:PAS domain-containing protein [Phaeobacter sp. B1627]TNJ42487.1 response regulator [Phaeobacter sp. B1627]